MSEILELSSPWIIYARKVRELFKRDPEIEVEYDEKNTKVIIKVIKNEAKAQALTQLLPSEKLFGGVTLKIEVRLLSTSSVLNSKLFQAAFEGNPIFKCMEIVDTVFSNPITYVVFDNSVVQYYSDNLGDVNAISSTLYENLAREIFEDIDGVTFSTDIPAGKNIEIWP